MSNLIQTKLDPTLKCEDTNKFYNKLKSKVIGQDEALEKTANIVQTFKAGFNQKNKPLAVTLFLGPTGTGKSLCVETMAECLFGNAKSFFRIDCGEFQSNSSVATLLGSPPGYIGFKETEPYISQSKLDKYQTAEYPVNILLFDEIEKANESILQLLLSILDKATLKTNNGGNVDFSRTIIFMTSNLGAENITNADKSGLGFESKIEKKLVSQIKKSAISAMEKFFKPEFVNRLDHIVVFNPLTTESLNKIFELELLAVRKQIFASVTPIKFTFLCSNEVKKYLLDKGYNFKYGARELRRVVAKHITDPLASLLMSRQIEFGDVVILQMKDESIIYNKLSSVDIYDYTDEEWIEIKSQMTHEEKQYDVLVSRTSQSM